MKQLIILFYLVTLSAFSQTDYELSGTVKTQTDESVSTGEIILVHFNDNRIIRSGIIREGAFILSFVPKGSYILKIICDGFEPHDLYLSVDKNQSVDVILNSAIINELDELTILGTSRNIINKNGNIKVNIDTSVYQSVPNVVDLLSKLPTILVSPDREGINILGRGPALIYIDNQKAGVNDLNALSVEDIKSIEIITNPSAKYEAEGKALILIKRKLSQKEGYQLAVSETASFKRAYNNYLGANGRYKQGSTEFMGNFNFNSLQPWERATSNLYIPNAEIEVRNNAVSKTERPQFVFGGGFHHQVNEDDYFSFSTNARLQTDKHINNFYTQFVQNEALQNVFTMSDNDGVRQYFNNYFNYNKKLLKIDAKVFTGLQYSRFYQTSLNDISNSYNGGILLSEQFRNQKFHVDVFSGKMDAEKMLNPKTKLESGLVYLSAEAKSDFNVQDYEGQENSQSRYILRESNAAAYTQILGEHEKLTYSAGLRIEFTDIKGRYDTETVAIDKSYSDLFPRLQLEYAIDSTKTFTINYSKSISRPNYSSTSQVAVYNSPYMIFARNINLDPAITHEAFAGFQYHDKSLKLSYFSSSNTVNYNYSYDSSNTLVTFSAENFKKETGIILEATLPYTYKWWNSTTVLAGILNKVEDTNAEIGNSKPYLYWYSNHVFKIPKKYNLAVTGWGMTHRNEGVFEKNSLYTIDFTLSKTFFRSLTCSVSYNDIFRNMTFDESISKNNVTSQTTYYTDTKEFSISLKYIFGKMKDTVFQEKKVDDSNRIN